MKNLRSLLLLSGFVLNAVLLSAQCLDAWKTAIPVTVDNTGGAAINNYQQLIIVNTQALISAGKMNADGSDIRFGSDCCTELCYWIEKGINTDSTYIWVRLNSVPANQSIDILMFYENPLATAVSDKNCVFQFLEDFEDPTNNLNWTHGTLPDPNGIYSPMDFWQTGTVVSGTASAPLGSLCYGTINNGDLNYEHSYLQSPYLNLTAADNNLLLTIDSYTANEGGCPTYYDVEWIEVSYDSAVTWVTLNTCTDDNGNDYLHLYADNQWRTFNYNITQKPTHIRFRYNTGDNCCGPSDQVGWYVNDIVLSSYTATPPSYSLGAPLVSQVSRPSDTTICIGSSVTLSAAGGISYLWDNTATGSSYTFTPVTPTTDVPLDVVDSIGCTSTDTVHVMISPVLDFGPDTTFCSGQTIFLVLDGTMDMASYLWQDGDTNRFYLAWMPGTYYVDIVDTMGCTNTDTITVDTVSCTGISEIPVHQGLSIYPNPTGSYVYIYPDLPGFTTTEIIDMNGRVLHRWQSVIPKIIRIDDLAKGIYIVRSDNGNKVQSKRLVIQ